MKTMTKKELCDWIDDLEKENCDLKHQNKMQEETMKENCELLNKMRCCGNCANRIDGQEFKDGCKENWDCDDYSKWRFEK